MRRYVPKTYNNRRVIRMIFRILLSVALAAVLLFIALFFWLKSKYIAYPDGTYRLEIPALTDEYQPDG